MNFKEELLEALDFGEKEREIAKEKDDEFVLGRHRVSLREKIYGIKGAFNRVKEQIIANGYKSLLIDEREAAERQVCCFLCNKNSSNKCFYCGCSIKKTWFMPIGKSELTTEGCPNIETYPHLKVFPPKNYWEVCKKMSSILFFYNEEEIENLKSILDKLVDNATGKIEIILEVNSKIDVSLLELDEVVHLVDTNDREDMRYFAKGDYIFNIEQCNFEDIGYDTKLKYEYIE